MTLETLKTQWQHAWPAALAIWSRFTRLSEPIWCTSDEAARVEGLTSSFAMIRLNDHAVVINLAEIARRALDDYALEILAHEIGHHVYCPADLTDNARMLARLRRGLPTQETQAPLVGNLYTDLLINDRLQRSDQLRISNIYQMLAAQNKNVGSDPLWLLYMRTYEILWRLQTGTLAPGLLKYKSKPRQNTQAINQANAFPELTRARIETDAQLCARLVRVYGRDWLRGAGRFAVLCLPYVIGDGAKTIDEVLRAWNDTQNAGAGAIPEGLSDLDSDEVDGVMHPAMDPELSGVEEAPGDAPKALEVSGVSKGSGAGQRREPFEYGDILKQLGIKLSDHEIAVRYYKEQAAPHLIRFPTHTLPESTEPLPEGLEPWDIGSPLENADWIESVIFSPQIIPGMTTVQRVYGQTQGAQPQHEPIDLDLYVDCSGSMPNPQQNISYLTLAGAIVALSALRVGSRVQATLWSGARQFQTTDGFVRDENAIMRILTGYLGGGTAFPIHMLRDTYAKRTKYDRAVHILIISDDGVTTMFGNDEQKSSGWDISKMALEKARAGGSMVLALGLDWQADPAKLDKTMATYYKQTILDLQRAHHEQGWAIHRVQSWDQLVAFARQFAREKYGEKRVGKV